jgi:hypothetical protein
MQDEVADLVRDRESLAHRRFTAVYTDKRATVLANQ